jgi:quercetin dioxygenase-like cupin family protein
VVHKDIAFRDERGEIIDILEKIEIEYVSLISSKKGAIRGNHYHKNSLQYIYVLKGKIKIVAQHGKKKKEIYIAKKGDLVYNLPKEKHAMLALEDSKFLVFTRGPRGGKNYEKDTFRLKRKLI